MRLVTLHARRRPGWFVLATLALVAALGWPRHRTTAPPPTGNLQVAVLRDGFAATHPVAAGRRVVELERDGQARRELTLPEPGDRRILGTSVGTAIAWQDGSKVRVAQIDDGRELGAWGTAVQRLCDGVASNDARFAFGWLEADGKLWYVHGPVAASGAPQAAAFDPAITSADALAHPQWCGVASADDSIALAWRDDDKLSFVTCTTRRCSTLPATAGLDRKIQILGFGCLPNACLFAVRDPDGNARLGYVAKTLRGKWTRAVPATSATVSVIGVGDRAFAVGYASQAGVEVVRFDREGNATSVWRDDHASGAPALAWSSGRLLVAHFHGDQLSHETIALVR